MGIIPPVTRLKSKISSIGINLEFGIVPPKNYYKAKISTIGISGEKADDSNLIYQIM